MTCWDQLATYKTSAAMEFITRNNKNKLHLVVRTGPEPISFKLKIPIFNLLF